MDKHADTDYYRVADRESAPDHEVIAALRSTGYAYTDPVTDPAYPGITAAGPRDLPDVFPEGWGAAPTERDRAAIDAGNA